MTTTYSQTVFSPWLTPVRLASTSNIAGTYYNGPNNNGVGATLTIAASSLTIDSVVCAVADRVLLQTQTNTYEQGIYVVKSISSTVVLERSEDQQCLEQLKAGEYVAVGAGSVNAGNFYTLIEPLPQALGIDAIVYNPDPSAGGVSFSGPASTANAIPVFSDTAGNIKAASTASTFGQSLSITGSLTASTSITATGGPITSGSSGDAGSFISFPAAAANGTFIFEALNAGGAFNTTLRNSVMGQSSVISIPDPGAATANLLLSTTAGGQTIAGGLTVSTGDLAVSAGTITASGAITSTAGNITSGSSGDAGSFISFPATAANGTLILAATNAGGAFNTTVTNAASVGQSQVISIPDVGAATGNFLAAGGALVSGNFPMASGTAGLMVDSGLPAVKGLQYAAVTMSAAQFNGAYAAPHLLIAAGGANTLISLEGAYVLMTYGTTQFANGGVAHIQYDSTANGAGVIASTTQAAANFFDAASTALYFNPGIVKQPFTTAVNKGLYFSNVTGAFDTGDSTFVVHVWYRIIPTV